MAKLIKANPEELAKDETPHAVQTQPQETVEVEIKTPAPATEGRRSPVIHKDTYESISAAQQIREQAQQQAAKLLEDAREEAAQILEHAAKEVEKKLEQAELDVKKSKEEALDRGFKQGIKDASAKYAEVLKILSVRHKSIDEEFLPQIANLSVEIARRIIGQELKTDPEVLVAIARRALHEKARQRKDINLRVHSQDLETLKEHKSELIEALSRSSHISLTEDDSIGQGGVVIETEAGTIDAQLETQLKVFHEALLLVQTV
jgi:flagellar assembly protein FliH